MCYRFCFLRGKPVQTSWPHMCGSSMCAASSGRSFKKLREIQSVTLIGKVMQAFGPMWGIGVLVVCVFLTFVWVMGLQVHICIFGCRDYHMPCYLYRSHCCWNQPGLLSLMCILLQCQNCTKFWCLYYSCVNITIGFPPTLGSLSSKVSITAWSILDPCVSSVSLIGFWYVNCRFIPMIFFVSASFVKDAHCFGLDAAAVVYLFTSCIAHGPVCTGWLSLLWPSLARGKSL